MIGAFPLLGAETPISAMVEHSSARRARCHRARGFVIRSVGSIIAGVPAKVIATRDSARANRLNAWQYHRNAEHTRRGDHRAWDGPDYQHWLEAKRAEVEDGRDL